MKKILLALFISAALPFAVMAQAPQKFNYQAVARDASGTALVSQSINVKISVLDGSSSGTMVYQETHPATTNAFGLFTVPIGGGAVTNGTFTGINWGSGAKYLKVEADFGVGYTDMGTSQLLSVPYALFAGNAGGSGDNWGTQSAATNSTLSGNGTSGNPLGIAAQGASNGQVMQWNGSQWAPATITGGVGDNWGTQSVIANSPLSGTGVSGNALKLQDGTANGQVLRWNGSAWVAATATDNDQQTLTIAGSNLSISGGNSVTLPASTDAQTLSIAGNSLSITNGNSVVLPTGTTYTAGSGITIAGNTISAADNSASNEIQTLSVAGSQLTISGTGGNTVTLPSGGTNYTPGTGISIVGTTISNTGDNDNNATNEIQTLSVAGNQLTISGTGGNTITLPGGGFTLPYTNTVNSASTLFDITNSGTGASGRFNNSSTTSTTNALIGQTSGTGYGLYAYNNHNVGTQNIGSFGSYLSTTGYGVGVMGVGHLGIATVPLDGLGLGMDVGVYGSAANAGIYGQSSGGTGTYGESDYISVYGYNQNATAQALVNVYDASTPSGYFFSDGGKGLFSIAQGSDLVGGVNVVSYGATLVGNNAAAGFNIGNLSYGLGGNYSLGNTVVTGIETYAEADPTDIPDYVQGVVGTALTTGFNGTYGGFFDGDLETTGNLAKASGTFKIDHPLDPANKYLYHSFVESPDMMNIYNGNVTTDANGDAVVALPDYFSSLNKDFKYQLTVIGTFAQAIVAEEVADDQFKIKTNIPNVKVSWQITGVRQDAWANAHRVVPEVEKKGREKGKYLHPELFGQTREQGIAALHFSNGLKSSTSHDVIKAGLTKERIFKK